jgi:hypothetical protein
MINFTVEDGTGAASATSYVSLADADDLAMLNIHSADAWLILPVDQKQNLLMYCSRVLDSRTAWTGTRGTATQGLDWPRTGVVDRNGNNIATNIVPYAVKWAVTELAKWSLSQDKLSNSTPENAISELRVDTITLKFADASTSASAQFRIPDLISDILNGLGSVRNSANKVSFGKLVRV